MGRKYKSRGVVGVLLLAGSWCCPAVAEDELLQPRGREAYEAHLKELEAKYGSNNEALRKSAAVDRGTSEAVAAAAPAEPAAAVPVEKVSAPTAERIAAAPPVTISSLPGDELPPGARVRVALTALGSERFRFGGEPVDVGALESSLERLVKEYTLDTLLLLETEQPIQARHLVELSRLSAHFKVPALYQRGQTLLAVSAAP